jgi:hypothetical protein
MAPRHAKLAAYKHELINLVQAVRHWRAYLWGCSFLGHRDVGRGYGPLGTATLTSLRQEVRDKLRGKQWAVVDDLVTRGGRIYVPASSPLVEELLATAHGAGHEGTQKTLHRLREDFFVPSARTIVRDFVRGCATCQKNKAEHLQPVGLLQPLDVPSAIWADISMDFIEGFPRINGKTVILTMVDRFSKAAHFITLGHPYTATTVARAFFTEIVWLHGIPSSIVSDRDPTFTSNLW